MKRRGNLFERIASFANLHAAFVGAAKGKRRRDDVAAFAYDLEKNLFMIRDDLMRGTLQWGPYKVFFISDAKKRRIMAAPFRDRVVHHAICNVIEPIFDRSFTRDTFACRKGKGIHAALRGLRKAVKSNREAYFLKCDVAKYFASMDHAILLELVGRKIKDGMLLRLIETLVRDPMPKGIPIGNLTSQLFANIYLAPLDRFVKQEMRKKHYFRYVDDFIILDESKESLHEAAVKIEAFLDVKLKLALHSRKRIVAPVSSGVDFVGYVVFPDRTRIRGATLRRFRRREKLLRRGFWQGEVTAWHYHQSVQSFLGFMSHADTSGLRVCMGF